MQVNFNSYNNCNNFGMAANIEKLPRVMKKVGPELNNSLAEAVPDLHHLGEKANIRIRAVKNRRNPNLNGFKIRVTKKKLSLLEILKCNNSLRGFVCAEDEVRQSKSMRDLIVELATQMVNDIK